MNGPPLPGDIWRAFGLALQGRPPPAAPPAPIDRLAELARRERLHGVLHRALAGAPGWPGALADALSEELQHEAILDAVRTAEDRAVLAEIGGVVLKGGALAHTLYASPHERPRTDLDVWVEDLDAADRALRRAGYTRHLDLPGDLRALARSYARVDERGLVHAVDLHATPVRSVVHVRAFDAAGAWDRARPLPALGARRLSWEDALVHAAIHRYANNPGRRYAVGLVDAALIARAGVDWDRALALAARARARSLLWTLLHRARAWLGAQTPPLSSRPPLDESRAYLRAPPSWAPLLEVALSDDLVDAARRGRELLYPDVEYLRARFGVGRDRPRWRLALARALGR